MREPARIPEPVHPRVRARGVWTRRLLPFLLLLVAVDLGGCQRRPRRARRHIDPGTGQAVLDDVAGRAPSGLESAQWGARLFQEYGCSGCHTLHGERLVAPPLDGIHGQPRTFADGSAGVVDDDYLRESLYEPGRKLVSGYPDAMPSYDGILDENQTEAVVAYLKSLR